MAYMYNQYPNIMEQLGKDGQPNQTNIFAEGQGSPDPSQGGEGANLGMQPKTTTEGDLSSGGGSGSSTSSESMPNDIRKQDSRALKRNIGKVSTPDFTNRIKNDLTSADQKLQAESDSYMGTAGTEAAKYNIDDATLDSAVGGDLDAQTKVKNARLATKRDYEDFIPQTKTEYEDVTNLDSSQGLNALLGKEARGQLSGREIAFDRSVLERSPEFIAIREALKGQQSALTEKAGGLQESQTAAGQKAIDDAISGAKDFSQKGLQTRDTRLRDMNQAEADAINLERKQMKEAGVPQAVIDQIQGIKGQLAKEFEQTPELRLEEILKNTEVDPTQFMSWNPDKNMADMVDENEAMKFNNIMMLLGNGGQPVMAGKGAGDAYSLDQNGLRETIVNTAQNQRKRADTDLTSESQKILDSIKAQLDPANAERQRQFEDNKAMIIQQIKDANPGTNFSGFDFNSLFGDAPGALSMEDLITESDSARLNQINKELGQTGTTYKAGRGKGFQGKTAADLDAAVKAYVRSQVDGGGYSPISMLKEDVRDFFNPTKAAANVGEKVINPSANKVQASGSKAKKVAAKKNPFSKKNRW